MKSLIPEEIHREKSRQEEEKAAAKNREYKFHIICLRTNTYQKLWRHAALELKVILVIGFEILIVILLKSLI